MCKYTFGRGYWGCRRTTLFLPTEHTTVFVYVYMECWNNPTVRHLCNSLLFPCALLLNFHHLWDCCFSVTKSFLTVCDPRACSASGFPVLYHLPEFSQTHVHGVSWWCHPTISSSLWPASSPALNLSQHQVLLQWVNSSCLTTSNLPWFMDLTFQVPMQYWLLFTASDLASITSPIHSWVLFLLWLHPFILSGVISPLISSSILGTYWPGEFLFQYPILLPSHTVHGVLKARTLKWFAIPFSSGPHSVRPLHHDLSALGGPTRQGLVSLS